MALVQAMVHATHLAQAGTLRDYAPLLGELRALMPYRSASFELDTAVIARILSLNPSIYEDIQFGNPYVGEMLDRLLLQLQALRALVAQGDDAARAQFRSRFLHDNAQALQRESLAAGNYTYERVGYLLADLTEPLTLSVYLPEDQPGSLRAAACVRAAWGESVVDPFLAHAGGRAAFPDWVRAEQRPRCVDASCQRDRPQRDRAGAGAFRSRWVTVGSACGWSMSMLVSGCRDESSNHVWFDCSRRRVDVASDCRLDDCRLVSSTQGVDEICTSMWITARSHCAATAAACVVKK